MTKEEIIDIIGALSNSLRENPNQFTWQITTMITGSVNPIGIANVSGGQNTGSIIGQHSEVSVNNELLFKIQQGTNEEISNKVKEVAVKLDNLSNAIKENDDEKINNIWTRIKNEWCPNMIISIVGSIIASYIK